MFYLRFFWKSLAHGQKVEPLSPEVQGVLGKSVDFLWKMNRGNESYTLSSLNIYNGTNEQSPQIFGLVGTRLVKNPDVTVERMNATILGDVKEKVEVTCKLTLNKIQFDDESRSFYLFAIFTYLKAVETSSATITLATVFGMHFSFFF